MQSNGGLAKKRNANLLRAKSDAVWGIVKGMDAAQIPETAYMAALILMRDVVENGSQLPMETRLDMQRTAETAKTLFTIARLASGESTSNVMQLRVEGGDLDAIASRIAALRAVQPATQTVADANIPTDTGTPTVEQ